MDVTLSVRSWYLWIEIVLLIPFQYGCLFFSLSLLLWLELHSTALMRSGKSAHPRLVPGLRGELPGHRHWVECQLWAAYCCPLSGWGSSLPVLICWVLLWEFWILSDAFSTSVELVMWFPFILLIWLIFLRWTILALYHWNFSLWVHQLN